VDGLFVLDPPERDLPRTGQDRTGQPQLHPAGERRDLGHARARVHRREHRDHHGGQRTPAHHRPSIYECGIIPAQATEARSDVDPETLQKVPLFAQLSDEARRGVAVWVNEMSVSEGKHLVDEGDYSNELFVIQDGTAEVLRDGDKIAELGPGDFFGEMGVLGKAQRNATVVATSPMRLLTLSTWDVKRLRSSAPELLDQINEAIEQRS
jgi:CRP/FNR family transcriptional regulator, cyclic AMP receptor protein